MSRVKTSWDGDELVERVRNAAREAVNETVDAARDDAEMSHEWRNRTMQLEDNIVSEHADDPADPAPTAAFGTTLRAGFYGLFHEEGTTHEHERPFLRPAADRQFPTLESRIKEKLK